MNTNIIKGVPLQNYNQLYSDFSKKCLANQPNLQEVKSDFVHLKGRFIHSRQTDNLCTKTVELVKHLINDGNEKLANMLINEIGKIHMSFRNYDEAERFIRYSMNLSQKAGDNFHVLARLNDLEQIYRYENKKKKVFEILRQKKECLKEIISDYDGNVQRFQSIVRPPTKLSAIKIQLAYTYSGIADMLWYSNPQNSLKATLKAKEIYENLEMPKQIIYLDEKIRRITERINRITNKNGSKD